MRTRSIKKNKINVITLGCAKNIVDSEVLMNQLSANGLEVVHDGLSSEPLTHQISQYTSTVIINTCGFIDNAKQESINTILKYAKQKNTGHIDRLYVTGCLSERYKPDLQKEMPEVDAYFGTRDLPLLLKTLGADYKHELIGERLLTTPSHFAYLKISEGCDRPCSFCAIPLMRGAHISKPVEAIELEIKNLVKKGTKEIILIAQDLTYYGLDLYGKRILPDLLKKISDISGLEWIRLQYAFPSQFPIEILNIIKERKNICKYLDIPLQHISDKMLKLMRRGITKQRTLELLQQIRETVPEIAIRTTLITGHPGEGEKEFNELVEFVKIFRFDRLGVFTYSHEENTHSYSMPDDVSPATKVKRAGKLMEIQQKISEEKNKNFIGKSLCILIDRKEGNNFIGRTEYDSPEVDNEVLIDARKYFVRIGDFAQVKITGSSAYDLYGEVI